MQRHPDQHSAASKQQVWAGPARCSALQQIVPADPSNMALHVVSRYGLGLPGASTCWCMVAELCIAVVKWPADLQRCLAVHLTSVTRRASASGRAACELQHVLQDPLDLLQGSVLQRGGMQIQLRGPCCRTRFYKAELQGSAAFDSNLEFGADSQAQVPSSTLPPLGKSSISIAAAMSSRLVTKVWGSEPVVVGADGLPVLESLAHRPKARVGHCCESCSARWP